MAPIPWPAAAPLAGERFRLGSLLEYSGEAAPALTDDCWSLTGAGARAAAAEIASDLSVGGIGPGDAVAVISPNSVEAALLYLATWRLGAVVAALNYRLPSTEIDRQLELLRPAAVAALSSSRIGREAAAEIELRPGQVPRIIAGRPASGRRRFAVSGDVDDPAAVVFTSGTTASPKGVVISHRGVARNTAALRSTFSFRAGDRYMMATPLCHVGGIIRLANALHGGAEVVLARGWDPDRFAAQAAQQHITHAMLVSAMLSDLAQLPASSLDRLSSLRLIYYGAGRTSPALLERVAERIPKVEWAQGYGQSEVTGGVTLLSPADHRAALAGQRDLLATVGRVLPGSVVVTVGDDGNPLVPGEPGEVMVGGEGLALGLLTEDSVEMPAMTRGCIPTGDVGSFDGAGYLSILDRITDVVKSGGLSVATGMVESVLLDHPAVLDAAVFGVPDVRLGERLAAAVVVRAGRQVQEAEIRGWLRERLAGFQVPHVVMVIPSVPRTPAGKVDKRALRQRAWPDESWT